MPASASASPGEPDPSFGSSGIATYNLSFQESNQTPWSAFRAIAIGPGGRIDAAGESANGEWHMLVAQTSEAGALEPSFGNGGFLITNFEAPASVNSEARTEVVEPDNSILLGGPWLIGKVTPRGQIDQHFLIPRTLEQTRVEIEALTTTANGDILAAGEETYGNVPYPAVLERSLPDGERDASFAERGLLRIPLISTGEAKEDAHDVLVLPDGKLIVAGSGSYNAGTRNHSETRFFVWLARLNEDGSLDRSFGSDGVDYIYAYGNGSGSLLAREPNGRLLLMGSIQTGREDRRHDPIDELAVWGFTSEGKPDPSFGERGRLLIHSPNPEAMEYARATAVDPEGRPYIVIHQWEAEEGGTRSVTPLLARLTPSGQLDSSYGTGGLAIGPTAINWSAIAIDPQGRAVLGGGNGEDALIERLLGDGSAPPSPQPAGTPGAGAGAQATPGAGGSTETASTVQPSSSQSGTSAPAAGAVRRHARKASCASRPRHARARTSQRGRRHARGCPRRRHRASSGPTRTSSWREAIIHNRGSTR